MTDDLVARALAAEDGVTNGPWLHREDACGCYSVDAKPDLVCFPITEEVLNEADANFIAASRSLVPELRGEVERLRDALNGLIPEWRDAVEADGGRFCGPEGKAFTYCADQIEAVLRGDQ